MIGIDTNVLVRALANDDVIQSPAAQAVLRADLIWVPLTVLLETEWVLRSQMRFTRTETLRAFKALIGRPTVRLQNEQDVRLALSWANAGLDLADALHLALSRTCDEFVTFDRDMTKVAGALAEIPVRAP